MSSTGVAGAVLSVDVGGGVWMSRATLSCSDRDNSIVVAFVLGVLGVEDDGVELQASGMIAMCGVR
jgi:hypothetical protein